MLGCGSKTARKIAASSRQLMKLQCLDIQMPAKAIRTLQFTKRNEKYTGKDPGIFISIQYLHRNFMKKISSSVDNKNNACYITNRTDEIIRIFMDCYDSRFYRAGGEMHERKERLL